jgi:ribosomal protein S18 acetylase RimI-like enzyme
MMNIPVTMIRTNTAQIPGFILPPGYALRRFRAGDRESWAEIETAAGEFKSFADALRRFDAEFLPHRKELRSRMIFLLDELGTTVGTGTAWYDKRRRSGEYGRLHWIAIIPSYQGRHLAKPLVSEVMKILVRRHNTIYLTTQTSSYKAVNLYLDFGFRPFIQCKQDEGAWMFLQEKLGRPLLPESV